MYINTSDSESGKLPLQCSMLIHALSFREYSACINPAVYPSSKQQIYDDSDYYDCNHIFIYKALSDFRLKFKISNKDFLNRYLSNIPKGVI